MAAAPTRYHWLKLRSVAHPTEVVARVAAAVRFVATGTPSEVPVPAEGEVQALPPGVEDTALDTHHGLQQHLLEVTVDRSRSVRDVLERVMAVEGVVERLVATLDARMDDDGVFYLRLDKQAAYAGRLQLTEGEDCVQVRLKVEAYPSGREASLAAVAGILERRKA